MLLFIIDVFLIADFMTLQQKQILLPKIEIQKNGLLLQKVTSMNTYIIEKIYEFT